MSGEEWIMASAESVEGTPQVTPRTSTASLGTPSRSHFPLIIFRGVEDSYTAGVDLECRYTVSAGHDTSSRDWVGLFKVGWRNQSEFVCSEVAPEPRPILEFNVEKTGTIKFHGTSLPTDDGEFYQFCYVCGGAGGQVLGASTPFQFRLDDFVAVEEENGELLVIKTKTAVLEEKLRKANDTRQQLKQEIKLLENERDMLKRSESELQKKLSAEQANLEQFKSTSEEKIKSLQSDLYQYSYNNEHYLDRIDSLQARLDCIVQEKMSMERRLDDNDRYIISLQDKIKSLVNEKDSLTGRVKSLEEEKELYKGHFTTSEDTLQSYVQECERVKLLLVDEQSAKSHMRRELERLETELTEQKHNYDTITKTAQAEKENVSYVTERMRNAEDKLSAAEHCKMMLNEEVLTLKMAYENSITDLEAVKLEMGRMTDMHTSTVSSLTARVADLSAQLISKEKDMIKLSEELTQCQAEQTAAAVEKQAATAAAAANDDGPLYALQLAQQTLKERFAKVSKHNTELQKYLQLVQRRMEELEVSCTLQNEEIRELRERLLMGQEAYKEKYIEWEKLETQLYHMRLNKSSVGSSCGLAGSSKESLCSAADSSQGKSDKLLAKAWRYKQQLAAQKQQCHHLTQTLRNNDEEISRLRRLVASSYPSAEYATVTPRSEGARKQVEVETDGGMDESCSRYEDVVDGIDGLAPPLKPLPAPIIPERLHTRLSNIRHHDGSDIGLNAVSSLLDSGDVFTTIPSAPPAADQQATSTSTTTTTTSTAVTVTVNGTIVAAHSGSSATETTQAEEERFEDARGDLEITVQCPCCPATFTFLHQEEVAAFLDQHFNSAHAAAASLTICPICELQFSHDMTPEQISQHVDQHF